MSDIRRFIRIAARRNEAEEYTVMRFRVLRSLCDAFRRRTAEEGISGNVAIEAFLQGYLSSHPAALAMVDQWVRDTTGEPPEPRSPKMSRRDLEEIYAAAGRGMMAEEETDG